MYSYQFVHSRAFDKNHIIILSYKVFAGIFCQVPYDKITNPVILRLNIKIVGDFVILFDSCGLSSHTICHPHPFSGHLFGISNTSTKGNNKELKSNSSALSLYPL